MGRMINDGMRMMKDEEEDDNDEVSKIALIMMATMMRMGMIMHQVVDAVRGRGGRIDPIVEHFHDGAHHCRNHVLTPC